MTFNNTWGIWSRALVCIHNIRQIRSFFSPGQSLRHKCSKAKHLKAMNRESQPLATDEPVEYENWPVDVQDFRNNFPSFWRNLESILQINKGKPKDCQHVTGRTWKHLDWDWFCLKSSRALIRGFSFISTLGAWLPAPIISQCHLSTLTIDRLSSLRNEALTSTEHR